MFGMMGLSTWKSRVRKGWRGKILGQNLSVSRFLPPKVWSNAYSQEMAKPRALIWLRRDLRLEDHTLLAHAESEGWEVALAFVFDEKILGSLPKSDRRVSFFHAALEEVDAQLRERGSRLVARHGDPVKEIPVLAKALGADHVLAAEDCEPYAIRRDGAVKKALGPIPLTLHSDQSLFRPAEIRNGSGAPYRVFTAYKNECLRRLDGSHLDKRGRGLPRLMAAGELESACHRWDLKTLGFERQKLWLEPGSSAAKKRLAAFGKHIAGYETSRNVPSIEGGTSGLSAHLRFGTISIRACARLANSVENQGAATWLTELLWRDFFMMILAEFPHVGTGRAFHEAYDKIEWPGTDAHFRAWKEGRTGFPLVDAAMRHFAETGWMHNRLRMVVASFLVKDLLVDWRKGEKYFAENLLDFDLAANNGGWQWSASTGCDSQPYFRVFNPVSQSEKFDPEGEFIKAHVPELAKVGARDIHEPPPLLRGKYPAQIVDHSVRREKAIALFKGVR